MAMKQSLRYIALSVIACGIAFATQARTVYVDVSRVRGDLPMELRKYCSQATYNDTVVLDFGKGTYTFDATIECKSHVIMKGKGSDQTKIVLKPGKDRNGQRAYISDSYFKFHGTPDHTISVSISDIAFGIVEHQGILWKDGERHGVKIYHANRVDIHDVDSYMENAYITNFDLRVCSNVSITNNIITNYNNDETGGCLWMRGEMHNVTVRGNKFFKYGKDETLGIFDNVIDSSKGHVRGVASRTNIIVEDNEFTYGGYEGRDKNPAAVAGMILTLTTNDLKGTPRCTTTGFHLRKNRFYINEANTRCIHLEFNADDVHSDICVENNEIINNDIGRNWKYYHDDMVVNDMSNCGDTIKIVGNTVRNKNLVVMEDGSNGYTYLRLYSGNVSLIGNKLVDEVTVNRFSGKRTGVKAIHCSAPRGSITMRDNVFKGIGQLAYVRASKGIESCTINAQNNYFAGNTFIYCDLTDQLNVNFTGNTLVSNSESFFLQEFGKRGSVIFNNNDVTVSTGNGQLMTHRGKSSTDAMKFDRLEVRNNKFKGVNSETGLLQNITKVKKRNLKANTYSR